MQLLIARQILHIVGTLLVRMEILARFVRVPVLVALRLTAVMALGGPAALNVAAALRHSCVITLLLLAEAFPARYLLLREHVIRNLAVAVQATALLARLAKFVIP